MLLETPLAEATELVLPTDVILLPLVGTVPDEVALAEPLLGFRFLVCIPSFLMLWGRFTLCSLK